MSTSTTTNPIISPTRFALAIADLPLETLHSKAAEIQNSLTHLRHSNEQMRPFAEQQGDLECQEAMGENRGVMARMRERLYLLRKEVEGRGLPFTAQGEGDGDRDDDGEVEEKEVLMVVNGTNGANGANGANGVNGAVAHHDGGGVVGQNHEAEEQRRLPSGRLTDEELRRQLEARMNGAGGDELGEGEEEGVHL